MINGHYGAAKLALIHDDRDLMFTTRRGGYRSIWAEYWALQGSGFAGRGRIGVEVTQFIPLYAPNLILALRALGGMTFGDRSYVTNFSLGGIDVLRGFLGGRFRGHHYGATSAELRFPIWSFISGVAFGEVGAVWLDDIDDDMADIGYVGGMGLRFGLPPDFMIKLRFDVGFSKDQWGIFFAFNEAF